MAHDAAHCAHPEDYGTNPYHKHFMVIPTDFGQQCASVNPRIAELEATLQTIGAKMAEWRDALVAEGAWDPGAPDGQMCGWVAGEVVKVLDPEGYAALLSEDPSHA